MKNLIRYTLGLIFAILIFAGCEDEPGLKEEDMTSFNKLIWIKGIWEGKQGEADLYESWRSKNYRTLEGLSYTAIDGQRVYTQTMKIEQSNNRILLSIKTKDDANEAILELKEANDEEVVFENPEGLFPEKVVYKKDTNNKMKVEVSGAMGEEDKTQQFSYKKTDQT